MRQADKMQHREANASGQLPGAQLVRLSTESERLVNARENNA